MTFNNSVCEHSSDIFCDFVLYFFGVTLVVIKLKLFSWKTFCHLNLANVPRPSHALWQDLGMHGLWGQRVKGQGHSVLNCAAGVGMQFMRVDVTL